MKKYYSKSLILTVLAAVILLSGCGKPKQNGTTADKVKNNKLQEAVLPDETDPRTDEEIIKSGILRVIDLKRPLSGLSRRESIRQREAALLAHIAGKLNLKIQNVELEQAESPALALAQGKGDILSSNLNIAETDKKNIIFSQPFAEASFYIVAAKDNPCRRLSDLKDKMIVVEKNTACWQYISELQKWIRGIKLIPAKVGVDTEELLDQVAGGKIDFTVADSDTLEKYSAYGAELKTIYRFPENRLSAWGIRNNSSALLNVLNDELRHSLHFYKGKNLTGDLDVIKQRRTLRVLTMNNPVNYYMHKGISAGFEYELAKKFAAANNLHLVMIVPPRQQDLVPWLLEGKGDIIAASVPHSSEIEKISDIRISREYAEVCPFIAGRKNETGSLLSYHDLRDRTIIVRKGSSYWDELRKLEPQYKFKLCAAPEDMNNFEMLSKIADGIYDFTMINENFFGAEKGANDRLKVFFQAAAGKKYVWLVRRGNPLLYEAINNFFARKRTEEYCQSLMKKYFTPENPVGKEELIAGNAKDYIFSRFDPQIRRYSEIHEFPWLLIAAQIYQESRFNPNAISWDGGAGLMQLMPENAREMGCGDPFLPDRNIKAGVSYMQLLHSYVGGEPEGENQFCFILAGYKGGYGHLTDARSLAWRIGLNPDIWKDNVEKAYMQLAKNSYAEKARYGYCQAKIVVDYVNEIIARYHHYEKESARSENSGNSEGMQK